MDIYALQCFEPSCLYPFKKYRNFIKIIKQFREINSFSKEKTRKEEEEEEEEEEEKEEEEILCSKDDIRLCVLVAHSDEFTMYGMVHASRKG